MRVNIHFFLLVGWYTVASFSSLSVFISGQLQPLYQTVVLGPKGERSRSLIADDPRILEEQASNDHNEEDDKVLNDGEEGNSDVHRNASSTLPSSSSHDNTPLWPHVLGITTILLMCCVLLLMFCSVMAKRTSLKSSRLVPKKQKGSKSSSRYETVVAEDNVEKSCRNRDERETQIHLKPHVATLFHWWNGHQQEQKPHSRNLTTPKQSAISTSAISTSGTSTPASATTPCPSSCSSLSGDSNVSDDWQIPSASSETTESSQDWYDELRERLEWNNEQHMRRHAKPKQNQLPYEVNIGIGMLDKDSGLDMAMDRDMHMGMYIIVGKNVGMLAPTVVDASIGHKARWIEHWEGSDV